MAKVPVFFSFHFDNDVMRVQLVRNIGALEDNQPVSPNEWEEVRRKGDPAIERWIDEHMKYRRAVVVLIGSETAQRPWVQYEICKAWNEGRGVVGIHIHNLKCPRNGTCRKGPNPFEQISMKNGGTLAQHVKCYDPSPLYAYNDIATNLDRWVDEAIRLRGN